MSDGRPKFSTALCGVLGVEYPILQSGMGNVAGPALVAEVCNAGGLGILAGTLIAPDQLRAAIREVRRLTDRPFGVNLLMMPELREPIDTDTLSGDAVAAVHGALANVRDGLGVPRATGRPPTVPDLVSPAIEIVLEEQVPVFSSGLGDPGPELNARFHDAGIRTIVMVTSTADARRVEVSGADVIVAQGVEAGGHRSHFTKRDDGAACDLGTMALVPDIVDAVDVPVVAAGGIVDGRGLVAALALGASGVLMGSRFLATRESMAPNAHKKRLLEVGGDETVVTDMITGRHARVVENTLTRAWGDVRALPFPAQYLANADVVGAATERDDAELLPLWAGQAIGRVNDLPWAADVVADTIRVARRLLENDLLARVVLD